MNRIDNNHATFINCLRDWNDPFLHGHGHSLKQQQLAKQFSCQRCESCACRINTSSTQTTTNLNDDSYTNNSSSQSSINNLNTLHSRKYTKRRNSNEINTSDNIHLNHYHNNHNHHHHHSDKSHVFQPIVRCKSSVNVPKTIDQCIKLSKSRPKPSSIRANTSVNNKSSNLSSLPPKKQNTQTKDLNVNSTPKKSKTNLDIFDIDLKDEEFCKIVLQSSPDTSTSNPSVFSQNTDSFKAFLAKNNQNTVDIDLDDLIKINKTSSNLIIDDLSHDLIDIEFIGENYNNNDNNTNNNNNDVNKRSDEINLNLNKYLSASTTLSSTSSNKSAEIMIETNNKDTNEMLIDEEQNKDQILNNISPIKVDATSNEQQNQIINTVGSLLTSTSSLIENEEIVYEDSLQDESFDSDR